MNTGNSNPSVNAVTNWLIAIDIGINILVLHKDAEDCDNALFSRIPDYIQKFSGIVIKDHSRAYSDKLFGIRGNVEINYECDKILNVSLYERMCKAETIASRFFSINTVMNNYSYEEDFKVKIIAFSCLNVNDDVNYIIHDKTLYKGIENHSYIISLSSVIEREIVPFLLKLRESIYSLSDTNRSPLEGTGCNVDYAKDYYYECTLNHKIEVTDAEAKRKDPHVKVFNTIEMYVKAYTDYGIVEIGMDKAPKLISISRIMK